MQVVKAGFANEIYAPDELPAIYWYWERAAKRQYEELSKLIEARSSTFHAHAPLEGMLKYRSWLRLVSGYSETSKEGTSSNSTFRHCLSRETLYIILNSV